MSDAVAEYRRRHGAFLPDVARRLEVLVRECLGNVQRVDRVTARAKDPSRFAAKAAKLNDDGTPMYPAPLTEMQDLLGVRVVVFYKDDVGRIDDAIQVYLRPIEHQNIVPDDESKFGYFGCHLILPVPRDVIPEDVPVDEVPRFFELQIKTLFQHAWSEADHDLGYKAPTALSREQQRRIAFTAAQAWGADEVFEQLRGELLVN